MTIERFFDDPRHRRSEELAFFAERTEETGALDKALAQYAEAAGLEEANALDVPGDVPRVRSLLAISAVALWLRAERWDDAARAGCAFLAQPASLTGDSRRGIQALVDRAWRTSGIEQLMGKGGAYVSVEVTLSGGLVRQGLAPSLVVAERRDVIAPLLLRVAEWRSGRRYRKAGPSALAGQYDFFEAPAIAGSYVLRLYVGATTQQMLDGIAASPGDVVAQFLHIAEAVAIGPEPLQALVKDEAYARAFLRSFRDLAPDGTSVGRVDLGAMVRGRITHRAGLTPEMRTRLSSALRHNDKDKDRPLTVDGVLKSVNLRGDEPKIGLETQAGARVFRIAKGEHDDTISPKLNRPVRILGVRRVSEVGEADEWAEDVIVLDEGTALEPAA